MNKLHETLEYDKMDYENNNEYINNRVIYPPELYYITLATKPNKVLDCLKKKVASNNEKIIVLGETENRSIGWESHQNFGLKLKEVHEFINQSNIHSDDIILFTDAYDVAYFGTKNYIINIFLEFKKPIVFGSEKYCNPDPELEYKYIDKIHEFPFLNSGLFIGRAWALRQCMMQYHYDDREDDQRFWTNQFITNPNLIELDYTNRLFLNTVDIDMSEFVFNGEIVTYKNKKPLFVHVNGPDKRLINELTK